MTDDLGRVLDQLAAEAERKWGFTYCECPACEFSVVVASSVFIGPDVKVACEMCWQDNGHMVPMTTRPATDADKPEGPDARYAPLERFTCADCGRECLSSVSEAEAKAEFEEIYHRPLDAVTATVACCDDCHKLRMAALGR
jgi:hypothetical protein